MPSKLDPFLRLLRLLKKAPRYRNVDKAVDSAFERSMKSRQMQQAMTRKIVRAPSSVKSGTEYRIKGSRKAVQQNLAIAKGGRVTRTWHYRQALSHLTEDAAARSNGGRQRLLFTNPNKGSLRPGIDHGYLSFDKRGRFVITASDVKAQQKATTIDRVSAQGKNLAKNLRNERSKALTAARDKARPYGERVYFRAVSMTINKILKGNPKSQARSISDAKNGGRLRLEVRNDGGNATGISRKLRNDRMIFDDQRRFVNGQPVLNKFRHGLIPPAIRRRYGLSGNVVIQRFPSRHAELTRRRGTPSEFKLTSGQATLERFRARLAADKQKLTKPARPVASRLAGNNPTGQKAAKPVGSRSAAAPASGTSRQAKSIGARPARPSGGSAAQPATKGGSSGIGNSKMPRPGPIYRPHGGPHGHH
jgi:hypothetical protein